ncbi:hypothetical protein [Listeria booriae]|uniref:hypothetical protein n=1 Tax=Listeria booriae TaxID=1552123 RepID=UPI0016286008|nr:hypothetical protein [Listeria booriae]MBC1502704.1 hypothetical protein [Listeria booriae]MBC1513742.1 hypothetical protein [Listeria booriae]MBC1896283.1 hypothetical protein [Listeria booriae]MBC6152735.1 hypothetical protein [Listeria booriae]MBC6307026.1 hypothetical protein [Listeria booriae]
MADYKIVLAEKHKSIVDENTQREVDDVQRFFNQIKPQLKEGTVNFVFLKGFYEDVTKNTKVRGVFVNNTEETLVALKLKLKLQVPAQANVEMAQLDIFLKQDFLGEIQSKEGFILHFNVPTNGLQKNQVFNATDISGMLEDVELGFAT